MAYHFVNSTYSVERAVVSSAESFVAMCQSAPLSWRNTLGLSCSNASAMESSHGSPCGMKCGHSMADRGAATLTSSLEGSHARTSVLPVMDPGLAENVQGCGEKWQGSFVKFDRDTSSWRTHQCSLLGDWEQFSGTWPEWGLMRNGECLALNTLALPTTGIEYGSLPTPTRTDYKGGRKRETAEACGRNERNNLRDYCRQILGWTRPYPDASESLMLWPIGWTDLKPLGMDKFQAWLDSRGRY